MNQEFLDKSFYYAELAFKNDEVPIGAVIVKDGEVIAYGYNLDPCPMCASAIKQARISNVYSALSNSDLNNTTILNNIFKKDSTNPQVNFFTNLDADKSKKLLNSFFKKHRD